LQSKKSVFSKVYAGEKDGFLHGAEKTNLLQDKEKAGFLLIKVLAEKGQQKSVPGRSPFSY
jgi:hypothetical protein